MVMPYSTAQGRQVQRDKFGRPFRSERTMGPDFSLDAPRRRVIAPRSPTVAAPGTPEEVARAFGGPIAFAPGASREQTAAAAARLAGPRFGPGEYAQYQRSIGVNTNPPPMAADPDTVRAVQGIVGASPARQERLAMAEGARPTVFVDGQGYMPLGGSGPRSTTGVSAGRTPFPGRNVGVGRMSSGVTTGGTFGSPLMPGQGPGGEAPTRQPFAYKPGRGPTITSPGGKSEVVSPEAFQQTWNQMSGNARGGALRMALAEQRERAAADPSIAANIASNQAAVQRQTGGAPAPGTNPLFDRERQRKELSRAGVPRPLAAALANLQGNPEAQAALVEQLAAEETERIQSFNQPLGGRGWQGGRERGGAGVASVVAAQAAARDAAARQKLEGDKLRLDQITAQWGPRLQMAQAALMPGSMATPAERRAAQQTIDEYNRFTDSAFGGRQPTPPAQAGTQQGGQPTTGGPAPIPPEYVPYGNSGVMVDPQSVTQLETVAANYSANPAAVGAQLVQMLNGPEFAHLTETQKEILLRQLTGNPSAMMGNPTAKPMSGTDTGAASARSIGSGRYGTPMTPHLVSPW